MRTSSRALGTLAMGLCTAFGSLTTLAATATEAAAQVCTSAVPDQDINGDGHGDVVAGAPGEHAGTGTVHVLLGTDDGLTAGNAANVLEDQNLSQDSPGVAGGSESGDSFGRAVVTGDFNADGCADMAVGVPGENGLAGAVNVLYGSPQGLVTTGNQLFLEGNPSSIPGPSNPQERFGAALAVGDLDDNGVTDLAVGAPRDVEGTAAAGAVFVLYGDAAGLNAGPTAAVRLTQASPGVPGSPEAGDDLGVGLAIGDFAGNGVDDLAIGVSGENSRSGAVLVVPGLSGGSLTGTGSVLLSQNTSGVTGSAEAGDRFGVALSAGDVGTDGRADLVVGVPGENGSGAIVVLFGSATGVGAAGNEFWTQNTSGVTGTGENGDGFGTSVAVGQLDGGTPADVAVGVPRNRVGSTAQAGSVQVFYGQVGGLSAGSEELWSQDTPGVQGTSETADRFGASVGVVNVRASSIGDLLAGVPEETLNGVPRAGAFQYFQSFEFGVTDNDQFWSAGTAEVKGALEPDGLLGTSVTTHPGD